MNTESEIRLLITQGLCQVHDPEIATNIWDWYMTLILPLIYLGNIRKTVWARLILCGFGWSKGSNSSVATYRTASK